MNGEDYYKIVKTPELDVVRAVIIKDEQILLVQEIDDENWKLPGGKIHENETILSALKREVDEELGVEITEENIVNYLSTEIPDSSNIRHIFLLKDINEAEIQRTEEVESAQFFDIEDLPETKFSGHITSAIKIIRQ
jgi:ADP-ribose pyrophosphatase YjhB (NUDIX family)